MAMMTPGQVEQIVKRMIATLSAPILNQKDGTPMSDGHRVLNFTGPGVTVQDDPTNRRTNIFISGGASQAAPTIIYSSPGPKALSLWNGTSNNSPPSGWQNAGFNDTSWATSVTPNGFSSPIAYNMAPNFGTAKSIWPNAAGQGSSNAERALTRQTFTLPSGVISSATLRILADSVLNGAYVNGTLVGSHSSTTWPGPTPPNFFDFNIPASLLLAGGSNLIAADATNSDTPGTVSGIIYRLTVNYGVATPPSVAGWTQVNMTGGSAADVPEGIQLRGPASSGADIKALVRSTPATPYTVTAAFTPNLYPANFSAAGMLLRDSASGKIVVFALRFNGGALQIHIADYTNATTFSADEATFSGAQFGSGTVWFQIQDDGTNVSFLMSVDGQNWLNLRTRARTSFLTADQIGIGVNSSTSSQLVSMTLTSWSGA